MSDPEDPLGQLDSYDSWMKRWQNCLMWGPYTGRGLRWLSGIQPEWRTPQLVFVQWISPRESFVWTQVNTSSPKSYGLSMVYQVYNHGILGKWKFIKFITMVYQVYTSCFTVQIQPWNCNLPGSRTARGHCAWRAQWEPAVADAHGRPWLVNQAVKPQVVQSCGSFESDLLGIPGVSEMKSQFRGWILAHRDGEIMWTIQCWYNLRPFKDP